MNDMALAPVPVTEAGYQDLRDYIQANWKYIEFYNQASAAVLRIPTTDPRCAWTHTAGAQTLILQVTLKTTDADITAPLQLHAAALFKAAAGGSALTPVQAFENDAYLMSTDPNYPDTVTVIHQIQVPQVA